MVSEKKRKKEARRAAKQEAEKKPVEPTKTTSTTPVPKRLFVFDNLNIHSYQREYWKEVKMGIPFVLLDYELKAYENGVQYIEKKMGESVSGKVYELTEEQLKETDWYETENNERVPVTQDGKGIEIYRKVKVQ